MVLGIVNWILGFLMRFKNTIRVNHGYSLYATLFGIYSDKLKDSNTVLIVILPFVADVVLVLSTKGCYCPLVWALFCDRPWQNQVYDLQTCTYLGVQCTVFSLNIKPATHSGASTFPEIFLRHPYNDAHIQQYLLRLQFFKAPRFGTPSLGTQIGDVLSRLTLSFNVWFLLIELFFSILLKPGSPLGLFSLFSGSSFISIYGRRWVGRDSKSPHPRSLFPGIIVDYKNSFVCPNIFFILSVCIDT